MNNASTQAGEVYSPLIVNIEPASHFKLERYYISEALDSLDGRAGVTRDEMAQLEFHYIIILDDSKHGIPNLEAQIAEERRESHHAALACVVRSAP